MTWLERSGHGRKQLWATACNAISIGSFFLFFIAKRSWLLLPMVLVLLFGLLGVAIPLFVRCRICGWRLETSAAARARKPLDRYGWMMQLQTCPVCGDDGRASPVSRAAWLASGKIAEPAYWSRKRILIGLTLAAIFIVGAVLVGANTRP